MEDFRSARGGVPSAAPFLLRPAFLLSRLEAPTVEALSRTLCGASSGADALGEPCFLLEGRQRRPIPAPRFVEVMAGVLRDFVVVRGRLLSEAELQAQLFELVAMISEDASGSTVRWIEFIDYLAQSRSLEQDSVTLLGSSRAPTQLQSSRASARLSARGRLVLSPRTRASPSPAEGSASCRV
eukprot:RCo000387